MKKSFRVIFLVTFFLSVNAWAGDDFPGKWDRGEGALAVDLKYCALGTDCIFHPSKEEIVIGAKGPDRDAALGRGDYTCHIAQKNQAQPLIASIKTAEGSLFAHCIFCEPFAYVRSEDFVPLTEKETNFDFPNSLGGGGRFISVLIVKLFNETYLGLDVIRADPDLEVTVNCRKK